MNEILFFAQRPDRELLRRGARRQFRYSDFSWSRNQHCGDSPDAIVNASSISTTKIIRVMIAADHPVIREGLVAILKSEEDIEIVGEAADGEETCRLYHELSPDVLMVDLRMSKKDGLQVVAELMSGRRPKPRIIVMTTYEDEGDVRRALKAGAKAHLVKGTDAQQFREAVRKVAAE